jgi:hypothetical protein
LRYQDQVQLSAVLRPTFGRLRSDADISDATAWILHLWRRRVVQLAEAGWKPFNLPGKKSRLPNAMSCPVAFVMTFDKKEGRRPCKLRQICPFCWARDVRQYWLKIDSRFFPSPPGVKRRVRPVDTGPKPEKSASFIRSIKDVEVGSKSPYDLVRRIFTFRLPRSVPKPVRNVRITGDKSGQLISGTIQRCGLSTFLDSRVRGAPDARLHRLSESKALLKAAGPGGGMLEVIHFRCVDDHAYPWEVQVHQVILAVDGANVPKKVHELARSNKPLLHVVIPRPKRRVVVSAVARALRYPDGLINPRVPVEDALAYLSIREGRRLVARYGCFRDKRT